MSDKWTKFLIFIVLIIIASLITVFTLDSWQSILLTALLLISVSYLVIFGIDMLTTLNCTAVKEGFLTEGFTTDSEGDKQESTSKGGKESDANKSKYEWLSNDDLFDDFYASVFTKLTQNENLLQAESAICMEEFTKSMPKDQLNILDAGCGIGIATSSFAKQGAGTVVGIDKSPAMIRYAKSTTLPGTTLTELQRQAIEFRQMDLLGPGAASAAEFTHACLLYFTVYYFKDLDNLFRNLHLWIKPGGTLAIEVVNKYKFEPVLDSANPWVGFSPQKYAKERITKSKVVFDKFDYEAVFELDDPKAEFRETFRFKDGSTRRQKHTMYMPSISDIVMKAHNAGFEYTKYVDLTPMSFSYGYILFFTRSFE
jgi:SAM-dependent methyltransferase